MAHGDTRMGRRLAAVLAADVAGYSRLMGVDEDDTLARLRTYRSELIDPLIAKRNGRIVKTTGDGLLVEFASVLDAVECAVEVQQRVARRNSDVPEDRRILYRMGINIGDIVVGKNESGGDDIFGDGVNVAARLEGLAEPGGICLSGLAYDSLKSRAAFAFDDLGPQRLKNIAEPVRVFRVRLEGPALAGSLARRRVALPLALAAAIAIAALAGTVAWLGLRSPGEGPPAASAGSRTVAAAEEFRPALIVLPFGNLSNDPEQEYFADGMAEDITTALARIPGFLVSARNTAFQYKGKAVDPKALGRDLGVRYVLEGSVRKQGDRLRLNAQLIEAATGNHVWAEKFDRPFADVFAVQDELVERVVGIAAANIKRREGEKALAAPPEKLEAYDLTMRARLLRNRGGKDNVFEARRLLERAIERDPSFGPAYAWLSNVLNAIWVTRWNEEYNNPATMQAVVDAAAKAVALAPNDPSARGRQAVALTALKQYAAAIDEIELALALAPNDADLLGTAALVFFRAGRYEKALAFGRKSISLEPLTSLQLISGPIPISLYMLGRFAEAAEAARQCVQRAPTGNCRPALVAALGQIGPEATARAEAAELLRVFPGYTISEDMAWRKINYRNAADVDRFADGLRKAGVPE